MPKVRRLAENGIRMNKMRTVIINNVQVSAAMQVVGLARAWSPPIGTEKLMAVPKRRMSRSNTRHRRSNWKATPVDLVPVQIQGRTYRVPRRLVRAAHAGYLDLSTYQ